MVNEALSINARDAIYSTRQTMQEADILNISEAEAPMMHSTKEEGKKNESMPMDAHSVPFHLAQQGEMASAQLTTRKTAFLLDSKSYRRRCKRNTE